MFTLAFASSGQFGLRLFYDSEMVLFGCHLTLIDCANVLILVLLGQTAVVRTRTMLAELEGN